MEPQVPKEVLVKAIEDNPEDVDALLELAAFYRSDNNPARSLEILESVLELDPNNPEAYLSLGLCWGLSILENIPPLDIWGKELDEEELLENSVENLEKAIELDPELTAAYNTMGRLYRVRLQEEEAVDMFKQSLHIDQAQLDVLEELQELTGKPVWELLDKETYMGDEEE